MRKGILWAIAALGVVVLIANRPPPFEPPPLAAPRHNADAIRSTEFSTLFDAGRAFSSLGRPGHYVIVEGYLDSCAICRDLERGFPGLLAAREDVLIRRVRFQESGSMAFDNRVEADNWFHRMGAYRFADVRQQGGEWHFTTCGTPHVEVYGPGGELVAGDLCAEGIGKDGLTYLRRWLAAEG